MAPVQTTQTQNIQPDLTIITLRSDTLFNFITSGNLSRLPLRTIPKNLLSHSPTSTNPKYTQQPSTQNTYQNIIRMNSLLTFQSSELTHNAMQNTCFYT